MLTLAFLSDYIDDSTRWRLFHRVLGQDLIYDLLTELFGVSVGHAVVEFFVALYEVGLTRGRRVMQTRRRVVLEGHLALDRGVLLSDQSLRRTYVSLDCAEVFIRNNQIVNRRSSSISGSGSMIAAACLAH